MLAALFVIPLLPTRATLLAVGTYVESNCASELERIEHKNGAVTELVDIEIVEVEPVIET
jgi:hypothetical protein